MPVHHKSPRKSPMMKLKLIASKSPVHARKSPTMKLKLKSPSRKSPVHARKSPTMKLKLKSSKSPVHARKSPLRMKMSSSCSMHMEGAKALGQVRRRVSNSNNDYIGNLKKDFPELDIESIPIKKLAQLVKENESRRELMMKLRMTHRHK